MRNRQFKSLVASEVGTSVAEFALFVGFALLTGVGFVCFSAGQLIDASSAYAQAPAAQAAAATRL